MSKPTHILLEYKSQKSEILFRASDGVGLAQRKNTVVIIGEDPNKGTSRVFIDVEAAHKFITEMLPAFDLAGVEMDYKLSVRLTNEVRAQLRHVQLERRSGEGSIVLPADVIDLPNQIRSIS